MEMQLEDNTNLTGQNTGFFESLLDTGKTLASAYNGGLEIYNSLPFSNQSQQLIEQNTVRPTVAVQNPATTNIEDQAKGTPKGWFMENQKTIIFSGVGLIALISVIAVVKS